MEELGSRIPGKDVEDREKISIEGSDVKLNIAPSEGYWKSSEVNPSSQCDDQETKPTPVPSEDDGKGGDVKSALESSEGDVKSSEVNPSSQCDDKETKPTPVLSEDDGKGGDVKSALEPTKNDGKSSDIKNVRSTPAEEGESVTEDTPESIVEGKSDTIKKDSCASSASTTEDCHQGARPKTKYIGVDSSKKTVTSKKSVGMSEIFKWDRVSPLKETALGQGGNLPESVPQAASAQDGAKSEGNPCLNWFKMMTQSPQKLMSKLKKKKSPKPVPRARFPSLFNADDPLLTSPGLIPIGGGRYAMLSHTALGQGVDRIDYSKLAEDKIIPAFLGMHPCYDVMPTSGKVIVLSVDLLVKNAFGALVANEIKAAPLWDTSLHDFVGMLTISDFINVLRHYFYSSPEDIKDIENQSIATWRRITQMPNKFIIVNGSDNLAQAAKLLIQEGIHRIPVFDEKRKCVLFVLTRKRLLQFLNYSLFENFDKYIKAPSFLRKTLRELKVGTYENIATTKVGARVIDALDTFVSRKVSSLPVVDDNGVLKDIFEKFDVFALAKEQTYHNLEMTVLDAITKAGSREGAIICTLDESFGTVINRFVSNKAHRIVVIDERRTVTGIISLSDILKFLVVQPLVNMEDSAANATSDIIEEGTEGAVGGSDAEAGVFDYGEQDSADRLTEESDKTDSSMLESLTDLKISPTLENPKEEEGDDGSKM